MSSPRLWGWWTEWKLDLLREYLPAFTRAATKATETVYLDLFAGTPGGLSRETHEPLQGGAEIALAADPPFSCLRLFELEGAPELAQQLRAKFPNRDLRVIGGDCNEALPELLESGELPRWAPTFAFIDPDGPDCWWATLEYLADYKRESSKYKVELWMLFPVGMMTRLLNTSGQIRGTDRSRVTRVFGTTDWNAIYQDRVTGKIGPDEARFEYVNLMRWRLEKVLAYRWTHAFEVRNSKTVLYAMIFATDNPAGNKIMGDTYRKFATRFPEMAEEARRRRSPQGSLFSVAPEALDYEHEPPVPPYGSGERE